MKAIQTCLVFFIVYTLLFELLPEHSFQKYLKLMGGLIFLLLFFQSLFHMKNLLPTLVKHYYKRMETESSAWADQTQILEEYREQIQSQIANNLNSDGYEVKEVKVTLQEEEIERISVKIKNLDEMDVMEIKNNLSKVYSVEVSHINVK